MNEEIERTTKMVTPSTSGQDLMIKCKERKIETEKARKIK